MAARRYEIYLQHEKRNFVSLSDHVIFLLLYKIFTMQQTTENHKCLTARENTVRADWSKMISSMCG